MNTVAYSAWVLNEIPGKRHQYESHTRSMSQHARRVGTTNKWHGVEATGRWATEDRCGHDIGKPDSPLGPSGMCALGSE